MKTTVQSLFIKVKIGISLVAASLLIPAAAQADISSVVTGAYGSPAGKVKRKPVFKKKTTRRTVATPKRTTQPNRKKIRKAAAPQVKAQPQQVDAPAKIEKFKMSEGEVNAKIRRFSHIKNNGQIAEEPFKRALAFYASNQHKISNSRYLGVIDFTKNSSQKRFCLIDMRDGDVDCMKTSHGRGSDGGGGWARRFSNRHNSHASSLGYYKTMGTYVGKHGVSLRLQGLSPTNSNALSRKVVIHGANYVQDRTRGISGRSHGCPALDRSKVQSIISRIKGGMIIYAWHAKHL